MSADDPRPRVRVVDARGVLDAVRELLEGEGSRGAGEAGALDAGGVAPDPLLPRAQEAGWAFPALARLDPERRRVPLLLCAAAARLAHDAQTAERLDRLCVRAMREPFDVDALLDGLAEVLADRRTCRRPAEQRDG